MNRLVNPEVQKTLRSRTDDSHVIQALMQSLWRGGRLLIPYLSENRKLHIRLQGHECLPVFTSYETAEAFQQMLLRQGGPALIMQCDRIESLLYPAPACSLAADAGQKTGVVLAESALRPVVQLTGRLTGGRSPEEDLPLMRLHMETVGNGQRAALAHACGCFHCSSRFKPGEITDYTTEADGRRTALCPRCGVDSVLTDLDTLPLTDELIALMRDRFFSGADTEDDGMLRLMYMQCVRERLDAQH